MRVSWADTGADSKTKGFLEIVRDDESLCLRFECSGLAKSEFEISFSGDSLVDAFEYGELIGRRRCIPNILSLCE